MVEASHRHIAEGLTAHPMSSNSTVEHEHHM